MQIIGMLTLAAALSGGWSHIPEQPRVEDLVRDLIGGEQGDFYYDGAFGGPVPIPTHNIRRATLILLSEDERRCTLTFDDQRRVVHDTKYTIFNGPPEVESEYEYGAHGLVRSTSKSNYEQRPSTFEVEYDELGRAIGSESKEADGRWRRTLRLDSQNQREVVLRETELDWKGRCTDRVHRIVGDGAGNVVRHIVEYEGRSLTLDEFETDALGRVQRWTPMNEGAGMTFPRTIHRDPDVTSVIVWGEHGEVLVVSAVHTLGNGVWIEVTDLERGFHLTSILDSAGRTIRTISFDQDGPHMETLDYRVDRYGNELELRRNFVIPKRALTYPSGFRWDVEYAETK